MILPCDVLLITGSEILGEAMLTGESQPIFKTAIPHDDAEGLFKEDADACKKYILFCGTKVGEQRGIGDWEGKAHGTDRLLEAVK
jgi:magnesium-transporting ATPase (P-type)